MKHWGECNKETTDVIFSSTAKGKQTNQNTTKFHREQILHEECLNSFMQRIKHLAGASRQDLTALSAKHSLALLTFINGSTEEFVCWLHVVEHNRSKTFWLSSSSPVLFPYSLSVILPLFHQSQKRSTLGLCSPAPTQWEPPAPAAVLLWKS